MGLGIDTGAIMLERKRGIYYYQYLLLLPTGPSGLLSRGCELCYNQQYTLLEKTSDIETLR